MIGLRRHPFTRALAGLLVAALTAAMAPQEAWASRGLEPSTVTIHADGIGSIRALTEETGAVTDTYTYSAFGELLSHVGTDPQPYAFAGEPYDPNAGFQYHRARWMDPRTGRFLGMDPFDGSGFDPVSLHRYLYAGNNPSGHIDPTGEFTLSSQAVVSGIINVLAGGLVNTAVHATFSMFRGEEVTEQDLRQAFLTGMVTAPVGGVMFRAFAPLLRHTVSPVLSALGSVQALKLVGKPAVERFLLKFARNFFNTNRRYPPVSSTTVGRLLQAAFPKVKWEMHHVYIQQAWTSGGQQTLYHNVATNEGLRRIGNGLINLLPIPRSLNHWLGQPGNEWAVSMLATIYYSTIVYSVNEADDAIRDAIATLRNE